RMPGVQRIETFNLALPYEGKYGNYHGFIAQTFVAVPVDAALEKRALKNLKSDDLWLRSEAATALRYFKSEENVKLVKALLGDPATAITLHAASNAGIEVLDFRVRRKAFETLSYWGIEAQKPVLEETLTKLERVRDWSFGDGNVTAAAVKDLCRFEN